MVVFYKTCTFFALVILSVTLSSAEESETQKPRIRKKFYVCPPEFKLISHNCYFFSKNMATWQNAHWNCKDRHSELTRLLTAAEDGKLRSQLNQLQNSEEWWIGGIYDWEQMQWKWGASGKKIEYHGFSRMGPEDKEKLKWHCIILDPLLGYKWSARSCVLGKKYICQTRVSKVNERGLQKLRKKYSGNGNSKLNEIPAPMIYPRQNRRKANQTNGNDRNLKRYRPNGVQLKTTDYAHSLNATEVRLRRKRLKQEERELRKRERKQKRNRKNRRERINDLILSSSNAHGHVLNGTHANSNHLHARERKQRNRRNRSKEHNSAELPPQALKFRKNHLSHKAVLRDELQRTNYLENSINPLHPKIIVEEHDFNI